MDFVDDEELVKAAAQLDHNYTDIVIDGNAAEGMEEDIDLEEEDDEDDEADSVEEAEEEDADGDMEMEDIEQSVVYGEFAGSLAQLELVQLVVRGAGAVEAHIDVNVQVARVGRVRLASELALNDLAGAAGQLALQVEHGLLPVRVLGLGARGEAELLVRGREGAVEVGHERVAEVLAEGRELERGREGELLLGHLGQVNVQDGAHVRQQRVAAHGVHERLDLGDVLDAAHVEAVDVFPEVELLGLVLAVLDGADVERRVVREHEAAGHQVLVARVQHRVQHGLVEQEVAHPLGDDDVHLVHGERQLLHLALDERDLVGEAVGLDDLARLRQDARAVDAVHMLGASLGGEHGQDAGAAAHVQHNLVLEQVLALQDGVHVRLGAHRVLEHLLMDAEVRVRVEVLVLLLLGDVVVGVGT
ncbi:hypothetical protein ON010_g14762 [Phytophthora cinnamomi]|nr:hypothetical protein ON010_g14762 [Phytophthora cinnamomi]